jgi:hypothetical protein
MTDSSEAPIVVHVVRQSAFKTIGNLKTINDPSYARNCARCKQSVVVSWLTEAMNAGVDMKPRETQGKGLPAMYPMEYVCEVCLPTPIPKYSPSAEDGPNK